MSDLILTESQNRGYEKIQKFLKSDQRYFLLRGRAGSGKTTLLKYALKDHIDYDMKNDNPHAMPKVAGIALAHKAKNVLNRAGIPFVRTFASAYGFKEFINDDGSRTFQPAKSFDKDERPIGHLDIEVFVHDEVSQYSEAMKKIIFDKTSMFSKVIFVGDSAQLPPIDPFMRIDADSPIFELDIPDECKHNLTERVRQKKGNPILDLSDIIIEEIEGNHNLNRIIAEILKPKLLDNQGYLCIPQSELYNEYIRKDNFLENKMIAFTKVRVEEMNNQMRDLLFPGTIETLLKDDLVFMTNNFKSERPFFKLNNADEFLIKETTVVNILPPQCDNEIECYYGMIDPKVKFGAYVITPTENGYHTYIQNLNRLISNANQNKSLWKLKYEFSDAFCDFTMGYAINAYRCQGSTYQNVFIDLINILGNYYMTPKRKLQTIYTALTRATETAQFIKPK